MSEELLFSAVASAESLCNSIKFSALAWKLLVPLTVNLSCRVAVPDEVRCPSCSMNSQPRGLIQLKNNPFPALYFGSLPNLICHLALQTLVLPPCRNENEQCSLVGRQAVTVWKGLSSALCKYPSAALGLFLSFHLFQQISVRSL